MKLTEDQIDAFVDAMIELSRAAIAESQMEPQPADDSSDWPDPVSAATRQAREVLRKAFR